MSSRQILKSRKHKFKIIVKKPVVGEFLASDGLIKVGFYRADSDPKLSWASPEMDGKCWHYRNLGNLWCGSQSAEESSTPGFVPGRHCDGDCKYQRGDGTILQAVNRPWAHVRRRQGV